MKHFIGTRFNLRFDSWKTAKDGSRVLTKEWLDHRFDLFEKYCLPSVINQKNNNFYWFIFLDAETTEFYKSRMSQLVDGYSNIFPMYIPKTNALDRVFESKINDFLDENDDTIITTRLDNDDAIHKDFTDVVQRLALGKTDSVLDIRKGYQLQTSSGFYECRKCYTYFNPFISVVENTKGFRTVYSKKHRDWKDSDNIFFYDESPLWIEVIHQRNKLNEERRYLDLTNSFNLTDFGIVAELEKRSSLYILYRVSYRKARHFITPLKKILKRIFTGFAK